MKILKAQSSANDGSIVSDNAAADRLGRATSLRVVRRDLGMLPRREFFWFSRLISERRDIKRRRQSGRVCFERRVDYVILIVYSHLNFNLLPFRKK